MTEKNKILMLLFRKAYGLAWRYQLQSFTTAGIDPHVGQGRVLTILSMQDEMEQKELGYLLDISKQALAEIISKLEKKGYITRKESEKDRRSFTVKLTEEGREAVKHEKEQNNRDIENIFDCLSESEQDDLIEYLERVIDHISERTGNIDDYAEYFKERFFARFGQDGFNIGRRERDHFDR